MLPTPSIQGVQTVADMNRKAADAGAGLEDMNAEDVEDLLEVGEEVGKQAGIAYEIEGAEGGLEQMAEKAAADEIVEGHLFHE